VAGMDKTTKLIQENKEKWGDKVRFTAVCLEGEDDAKEILTKKPDWE